MTDEELEDYLARTIKKEIMVVPETLDARIIMHVQEILNADDHKVVKFRWRVPAAAAVVCVFLVSAISVYAGVNHYQERMASLSGGEKDQYVYELDVSRANADSFSRKLTEQEFERFLELDQEYRMGRLFPESTIVTVAAESEAVKGKLAFAADSSTFLLPDSVLSDEEMLEIIDFYHKRDYSLAENRSQTAEESDSPVYCLVTQSMAVQTARTFAEEVCGINMADSLLNVELDEGEWYLVSFSDLENLSECRIFIDDKTGKIVAFDFIKSNQIDSKPLVNEEEYIMKYADMESFLRMKLSISNEIVQAYCTYNRTDENLLYSGVISYTFLLDDGNYYVLSYDVYNDQIREMHIFSSDEYQNDADRISQRLESQGIMKKRIDFVKSE